MHCLGDLLCPCWSKGGELYFGGSGVHSCGHKSVNVSVLIYLRERIALGNGKVTFQATFFNLSKLALEMRFSRQGRA